MTLDVYADLFDEDLDGLASKLDAAIRSAATTAARRAETQLSTACLQLSPLAAPTAQLQSRREKICGCRPRFASVCS
jgi:hypothetical protein